MNKNLIAFGIGLFALPFLSASAIEFPSSDIDMDASFILIDEYIPNTGAAPFSCPNSPIGTDTSFTDAGWNAVTSVFDNLTECFRAAGEYALEITVIDNAGNRSDYNEDFVVAPGTPVDTTSTINGSCTAETANYDDECTLVLVLRDEYGNQTFGQSPRLYSPTGSFSDDANSSGKTDFRNGLYNGNSSIYNTIPFTDASPLILESDNTMNIRAVAPSIQRVGETIPELQSSAVSDSWLSNLVTRNLDLVFTDLREVELNGDLSASQEADEIEIAQAFRFTNPFESIPSVGPLEIEQIAYIEAETEQESGASNTTTSGNVNLVSVLGNYCEADGTSCGDVEIDFASNFNPLPQVDFVNKLFGEPDGSVLDENASAFFTSIEYTLNGQNIGYPSGAQGQIFSGLPATTIGLNSISATVKFIGADIEGFVSTDEDRSFLGTTSNQIVNIGLNSNKTDVYENIVQNGWQLVRNSGNKTSSNGVADVSTLFGPEEVLVVDLSSASNKTFTLNNLPEGNKTLVVVNGNLVIASNLQYANSNDSFGAIILRTDANPYPAVGNIFVRSNVQQINGSFFADGAFANNTGDTIATANQTESTTQLLLKGSLLSRNTLGGSLRNLGSETDYTPWETDATNSIARTYDLHYVRRYDSTNGGHTGISGETNTSAFIIRPDQKSTILPPPGFKLN